MKKILLYVCCWAAALGMFNIFAFLIPSFTDYPKFTQSFWIGYYIITGGFVAQLVLYFLVKARGKSKAFLNISLNMILYITLAVTSVAGLLCMALSFIPVWVAVAITGVACGVSVIALCSTGAGLNKLQKVEQDIQRKTTFIKEMTAESDSLQAYATTENMQNLTLRVYEAFRYSDPMSDYKLHDIEEEITYAYKDFAFAVKAGNESNAEIYAQRVIASVQARNSKLKTLK